MHVDDVSPLVNSRSFSTLTAASSRVLARRWSLRFSMLSTPMTDTASQEAYLPPVSSTYRTCPHTLKPAVDTTPTPSAMRLQSVQRTAAAWVNRSRPCSPLRPTASSGTPRPASPVSQPRRHILSHTATHCTAAVFSARHGSRIHSHRMPRLISTTSRILERAAHAHAHRFLRFSGCHLTISTRNDDILCLILPEPEPAQR